MPKQEKILVVGAGLAGCECAWQLAKAGFAVDLFEMRPEHSTAAHQTAKPAELVCSNSFKSLQLTNGAGLLKAELKLAESLIIQAAEHCKIPAGTALGVDKELFSQWVEEQLCTQKNITSHQQRVNDIAELSAENVFSVIATGPLTGSALAKSLQQFLGEESLYFYDSIAPIVFSESLNQQKIFQQSRYGLMNEGDYLNCPFNALEYGHFVEALKAAKKMPFQAFEDAKHFESCLPIETLAERGDQSLAFGPLKPVGLKDTHTNQQPYAVLQLRQENRQASLYNLVGCQTKMVHPAQKEVFRLVPGLENAEFARLGSMHRNTYVNAPKHLNPDLSLRKSPNIFLAGQITGVEGYAESTAMGMWVAMQILHRLQNKPMLKPNPQTMVGALVNYLQTADPTNFQPMNSNFGLLKAQPRNQRQSKQAHRLYLAEQAVKHWQTMCTNILPLNRNTAA